MKRSLLATLLISIILLLAACGGEDTDTGSDSTDNGSSDTEQSTETAAADPNNEVNLVATNFEFEKDQYVVKSGEEVKVTLTNKEGNHGISIDDFDVMIQGDGEATFTPTEPGEYKIYCNIMCGEGHADMVATLIVQ
ncbi:cupredoxin domain-containing protein [Ornithinibacillus xuwenensis]|jgi:cytochrome c oxidase subunit II|uniref:Cupredoxin domain-containing protein n=1 Tax=Ornithinibacillus xuwenensis TaxID=3144668 RepID=A0ABU9XJA4_9BACI